MNFFDYLNSINQTKKDIMLTDDDKKAYSAFMINRGLSYFPDTVLYSNMLNTRWHLDPDLQYRFLLNTISKKKRFSKWFKAEKIEDIDLIKEYFGYSDSKAKEALSILTEDQIEGIREKTSKGGMNK